MCFNIMISIVVCSRNLDDFEIFSRSLSETIGIEYELVRIENESNQYSICEAYNLGVSKSKFKCVCFCHEDVVFKTQNWGVRVLAHLSEPKTGLIGVAGSDTFSSVPNGWWVQSKVNHLAVNIVQGINGADESFREFALYNGIDVSQPE